jgi:primosomal protein N'
MSDRFALVALPLPLATPYTYRIPETLGDRVVPGARVVVPVRRRELIGLAVAVDTEPPAGAAKAVLAVPDLEPALPPPLLATAEWMAGYYGAPLGLTLKAILPGGMWGASRVIVSLRNGHRAVGGLAGEVVAWLEQRGGEAAVASAARALKRPLWDVIERLARVEAVALRVQPPDTDADRLTERTLSLAGERPTLIERDILFKRRPKQRQLY